MPISSSSLIHLTRTKESLIGILTDNFRIKYCRERIVTPAGIFEYAIPMVSFCDIPMSQIKNHIESYGSYGIGLSQDWGRKNGLNPVLYVDTNSSVGKNYRLAFEELVKGKTISSISDHDAFLLDVLRYMKNYEAELVRHDGTTNPTYRFADEKEWRYVPSREECSFLINIRAYTTPKLKEKQTAAATELRLKFEPQDIKYIIINDESEVLEILNLLPTVKGKYSTDDVRKLTTRIITSKQILLDF